MGAFLALTLRPAPTAASSTLMVVAETRRVNGKTRFLSSAYGIIKYPLQATEVME